MQVDGVAPSLDTGLLTADAVNSMGSSDTPKTPTEGAWLALMEDDDGAGKSEKSTIQEHRSPNTGKSSAATPNQHSSASNKVATFWENLMNSQCGRLT